MITTTKYSSMQFLCQCLLIGASILFSQIQISAQGGLICNESIQISLKENCQIEVRADHILENPDRYIDYLIKIEDNSGYIIPDHIVTAAEVGEELKVTVTDPTSSVSCWSTLIVDSKIFPEFQGCGDIVVPCSSYPDTLQHMEEPELIGSKCGVYQMSYEDSIEKFICPEDKYSEIIHRTWTIINMSGYAYTCTQNIYVKQQGIDDIKFPPDYDGRHYPAISCDFRLISNDSLGRANQIEFLESGFPSTLPYPRGTGSPGGEFCHNIKLKFEDTQFSTCGNESKILRKWHVIDWCTGESLVRDQVIKLEDDAAPIIIHHDDSPLYFSLNSEDCTGIIDTVPFPFEVYDCSPTTYELSYKIKKDTSDPYDSLTSEGLIRHQNGSFGFSEVPLDTIYMVYTITDECGHTSMANKIFVIKDKKSPIAICEKNTVITLSVDGSATLIADKVNHFSYDNCAIVDQKIKRDNKHCNGRDADAEFGDEVHFCCTDTDQDHHNIILRVFDAFGNFSDCHTQISIQDKVKPIIEHCPTDISLHCYDDYHNIALTNGEPAAYDNCSMQMEYKDNVSGMNACGIGDIYREWKVSDYHGNWETCIQHIKMSDHDPLQAHHIKWPRHKVLSVCHYTGEHLQETGEPKIIHQDCGNVGFTYEDQIFYDTDEACAKILRTWAVIDWCKYDPGSNISKGYWTHVQQIKVNDETIPQFTSGCEDILIELDDGACEALVNLQMMAEDACTLADLEYSYTIDLHQDGKVDSALSGAGATFSHIFPAGLHLLSYQAVDGCGNGSPCHIKVHIENKISINQICIGDISVALGVDGQSEIWAKDFIKDVSMSCGVESTFTYAFSSDANETLKIINCNQFAAGAGVAYTEELEVFALADNGHYSSCRVELKVTDNFNVCSKKEDITGFISGKILDVSFNGIENMMIKLKEMNNTQERSIMTDGQGAFSFDAVNPSQHHELIPEGYGEASDGVSTLDIITLQQHILGHKKIDTSYKLVAADVDGSKSISVSDLLHIRKVILGYSDQYPISQNWTFINSAFEFADPEKPYFFPDRISINNLGETQNDIAVISVKMGDVNGSITNSSKKLKVENRNTIALTARESQGRGDNNVAVMFYPEASVSIFGWQYELDYDEDKLEFVNLLSCDGRVIMGDRYKVIDGRILISETYENEMLISDEHYLFSAVFKKKSIGDHVDIRQSMKIESTIGKNEIYDHQLNIIHLSSNWEAQRDNLIVNQNAPNPFTNLTTAKIDVKKPGVYQWTISDTAGNLLLSNSQEMTLGVNYVEIDLSLTSASGLMICQVSGQGLSKSLKIFRSHYDH